ncbi:hypothetical protein FFE54_000475 [Escherichia coli]|uniref:hypothetical protein n=1 Tax=Escherichia coli TaxID=562 RepID=UPI001692E83E|nr:hypothetical protein [Escherichia coli]EET4967029.1 hypothetical protein [Escherichia coli]EET5542667.1 hypothetical protein [Escherichia coli]EET5787174.1 hypothetical protein [Escherichia coli]EET5835017.1 hypothetical protein [Escherichia coli]
MFREFPAPAGINRSLAIHSGISGRVPRASGDKPGSTDMDGHHELSSPRQRG